MLVVLDSYTNFCFINLAALIVPTVYNAYAVRMFSRALLSLNLSISSSWVCSMVCFNELSLYG
jgi:hypothetical protein